MSNVVQLYQAARSTVEVEGVAARSFRLEMRRSK